MPKVSLVDLAQKAGISHSSMRNVFKRLNIPQVGQNASYNLDDDALEIVMLEAKKIKPNPRGENRTVARNPNGTKYFMEDITKKTGLSYGTVHAAIKTLKDIKMPGKGGGFICFNQEQYEMVLDCLKDIKPRSSAKRREAAENRKKAAEIAERLLKGEAKPEIKPPPTVDHGMPLSKTATVEVKPAEVQVNGTLSKWQEFQSLARKLAIMARDREVGVSYVNIEIPVDGKTKINISRKKIVIEDEDTEIET